VVEFDHFMVEAGIPIFTLSAKEFIEKTLYRALQKIK